jgi:hypothetical protein
MSKQSFVTGQVLTAQQVNDLQTNDFNQTVSAKTANYTLVAADKGTRITMNSTSATTITVNTGLFEAGDTLFIQNLNTGVSTITAGTATVSTASSLALAQHEGGTLYFTSAGVSTFYKAAGATAGGGGKVLQVLQDTLTTELSVTSTSYADTGLTITITPSSATSKVLVMANIQGVFKNSGDTANGVMLKTLRGATNIVGSEMNGYTGASTINHIGSINYILLDEPATTSATTYKVQIASKVSGQLARINYEDSYAPISSIIVMEIGA